TQIAFNPPETFRHTDEGHPVFAPFRDLGGFGRLTSREVRRHYIVEPNEGTATIAAFSFESETRPALVVRPVDRGRVALLATGVDTVQHWSVLLNAEWEFLAFADLLTPFLTGRSGGRRNYEASETAMIRVPRTARPDRLLLRSPDLAQSAIDLPPGETRVTT